VDAHVPVKVNKINVETAKVFELESKTDINTGAEKVEPKSAVEVSKQRGRITTQRRMSSRSRSSELVKVIKVPE